MAPAVIYAAKSTEDRAGSIPSQLADCRTLAEREGWEIVDEFKDENVSAYTGNRGPGLEDAKRRAVEIAAEHGRAVIVAQDADRFARGAGDQPGSAEHLFNLRSELGRQGVEMWTVRFGRKLERMEAFMEGERSFQESDRRSQATRAGKRRRAEAGESAGPVSFGYRVEYDPESGVSKLSSIRRRPRSPARCSGCWARGRASPTSRAG